MLFSTLQSNLTSKNYDWSQRTLKTILLNASDKLLNFMKNNEDNKDLVKAESHLILLKAVHIIIKPVIKIVDLETYNNVVNACFSLELNAKYIKSVKDKEALVTESSRHHLAQVGILKNPELEYKVGVLEDVMQVRQGIVLVGDTYCGKSTAIEALKSQINANLLPQFKEFYEARCEEKIKTDEKPNKSKDSEVGIKMFRSYLNEVNKSVESNGLVDVRKINPKTFTVEEFYGS
jgi:hypothetical protein